MTTKNNYEEDLHIDPDALDIEWLNQPKLYMKYCELSAEATRDAMFAHEQLKTIRAELAMKAYENGIPGVERMSDPKVDAFVRTEKRYKKAKATWIEAEEAAQLLKSAVFAFSQRKDALGALVQLHGQQYFAGPRIPRNITKEWEDKVRKRESRKVSSSKMKRRRNE